MRVQFWHFVPAVAVLSLTFTFGQRAQAQQLPDAPVATARLVSDSESRVVSEKTPATDSESHVVPEKTFMIAASKAKPVPVHRFFDRTSFLSMGVETGALLADGIATQARLGQIITRYQMVNGVQTPYQVRVVEVDPIGKLFVNHGWPGTIAGGAVTLGADMGIRYWLHKTNHHKLERVVPFAIAASNAFAAWHDTRY